MEHLGIQIKRAREARSVGLYTLARELKASPHTLKKLESEGWCRHPELVQQISTFLGAQFVVVFQPPAADGLQ
jgi:ribosome-binding protein aMBF1 (putative translation factor)